MHGSNRNVRFQYGVCTNRNKKEDGTLCSKATNKEVQKILMDQDFVCSECGNRLVRTNPPSNSVKPLVIIISITALALLGVGGYFLFSGSGEEDNEIEKIESVESVKKDSIEQESALEEISEEAKRIDCTSISFDVSGNTIDLEVGDVCNIDINMEPADADETIEWKSSNKYVVAVSPGELTAVSEGNTNIIVETSRTKMKAVVNVSVTDPKKNIKKSPVNKVVTLDLGYALYIGKIKNGKMHDNNGVLKFKSTHIIESRDVKARKAEAGEKVVGIFENGHLTTGTLYKKDGNKEVIIP